MMVMSAKEFSQATGFPLATIRRLCRERRLPCWKTGRVYYLSKEKAVARLELLKETETAAPEMAASPRQPRRRQRFDDGQNYGSAYLMELLKKKEA